MSRYYTPWCHYLGNEDGFKLRLSHLTCQARQMRVTTGFELCRKCPAIFCRVAQPTARPSNTSVEQRAKGWSPPQEWYSGPTHLQHEVLKKLEQAGFTKFEGLGPEFEGRGPERPNLGTSVVIIGTDSSIPVGPQRKPKKVTASAAEVSIEGDLTRGPKHKHKHEFCVGPSNVAVLRGTWKHSKLSRSLVLSGS